MCGKSQKKSTEVMFSYRWVYFQNKKRLEMALYVMCDVLINTLPVWWMHHRKQISRMRPQKQLAFQFSFFKNADSSMNLNNKEKCDWAEMHYKKGEFITSVSIQKYILYNVYLVVHTSCISISMRLYF